MSKNNPRKDGTQIVVYVYPYDSDKCQADSIKFDGTLDRWMPGTGNFKEDMYFADKCKAIAYARAHYLGKEFFVRKQWPPTPPSCEWPTQLLHHEKTIVYFSLSN